MCALGASCPKTMFFANLGEVWRESARSELRGVDCQTAVGILSPVLEKKRKLGMEAHLDPFPDGWEAPLSRKEAEAFLKSRG